MSRLFEQIYNNSRRLYHCSKDLNLELTRDRIFFISNDEEYAKAYARTNRGVCALYEVKFSRPVKIFNARSEDDARWMRLELSNWILKNTDFSKKPRKVRELPERTTSRVAQSIIEKMKDRDWFESLNDVEENDIVEVPYREDIIKIIEEAGFDGFFNFEVHPGLNARGTGLGVFDSLSSITLLRKKVVEYSDDVEFTEELSEWMPIHKRVSVREFS
jgi:hypothetical protein